MRYMKFRVGYSSELKKSSSSIFELELLEMGYFCDRWSFVIYIKFVTSGIRYQSIFEYSIGYSIEYSSSKKLDSHSPIRNSL